MSDADAHLPSTAENSNSAKTVVNEHHAVVANSSRETSESSQQTVIALNAVVANHSVTANVVTAEIESASMANLSSVDLESDNQGHFANNDFDNFDPLQKIEYLEDIVTRLIPPEQAINHLYKLFSPKKLGTGKSSFGKKSESSESESDDEYIRELKPPTPKYLNELALIESQITPELEPEKLAKLSKRLKVMKSELYLRVELLNSLLVNSVDPILSRAALIKRMESKIGHPDLKEEANIHLLAVYQLVEKLKQLNDHLDVMNVQSRTAVHVMTAIERRRYLVEELVNLDKKQIDRTLQGIVFYIIVVITLITIGLITLMVGGFKFPESNIPLTQLKIPLLGVPLSVIAWSLIGSFAAMIHRFNKRSIYDFTDTVKWMLTRHIQGIVLSSAFYLVLVSGLFLVSGTSSAQDSNLKDEVVLVLSFLIGFSDRFVESVFETLV